MMSEAVKLARIKARSDKEIAMMSMVKAVASNPAVELIGSAFIIIEMKKAGFFDGVLGSLEEVGLMAMVGGCVGLQQVAPLAPYIAQGAEGISKAVPGILALAAGA